MYNSNFLESACTKTICVNIYCLECKKNNNIPCKNENRNNKQCLLDTPRVTVHNKRLISKCKKSEKKYAYTKVMALLRITKDK